MTRRHRRQRITIRNARKKILDLLGGVLVTGWATWYLGGEPGHGLGLAILWLIGIPVYPLITMTIVLVMPAVLSGLLIPRAYRIRYRQKRGRYGAKSAWIPQRLRNAVYFADRHRCVSCGARTRLQVDHRIPWAGGGVTSVINCFTLCTVENNVKSNYSVDRDNYVHYRAFTGEYDKVPDLPENRKMLWAARILAIENRKRWNIMRWLRMSWAMI